MQRLKTILFGAIALLSFQAPALAVVSPLQRPAVDVAWFRSEDWSLEVACSVNGCSVNNAIVEQESRGFYTILYTEQLAPEDCVVDIQKQFTHCHAENVDVSYDFETYPSSSLTVIKEDDNALVEVKDGFGNIIYSSRKNVPFQGCAFNVPENGAYVGIFGSRESQPFETIILADGTNKSACDNRPVERPQRIKGLLKSREIQCVSRDFALSLNVGAPYPDLGNGGGPYYLFKQDVAFEMRARNETAAKQLGLVTDKPVDVFTLNLVQSKRVFYEDSVGISVFAPSEGDPFLIYPAMWAGNFAGENIAVILDANSNEQSFLLRIQNANEGAEQRRTEISFPLQNCSAFQAN